MLLFQSKHQFLNTLLVIGFDPSHRNKSPEIKAPLKILSTLLRAYENEAKIPQ
jgi:hypothetical protein